MHAKAPAAAKASAAADDEDEVLDDLSDEDEDDEELDLFGEATDEEKAARQKVIDEAKKRGEAKAKLTKSMIVLDVKPWDDTTGQACWAGQVLVVIGNRLLRWGLWCADLKAMEEEVRAIKKDGLLWGASEPLLMCCL